METIPRLNRRLLVIKEDPRKRKLETLIMKRFTTIKGTKTTPPKKEYIRCKVIRGHKKMIRNLIENTIPKKGIAKFKLGNSVQKGFYRRFQDHLSENMEILDKISKTESGPLTDGKNKVDQKERMNRENSFNNKFCRDYFEEPAVRHSFKLFFEIVFSKFNPKKLQNRFGFSCCGAETHVLECFEKWQSLKYYLQNELFESLGFDYEYFDEANPKFIPDISYLFEFKEFIEPYMKEENKEAC